MAERRAGKLGALPTTADSRTLAMARYVAPLNPPAECRWSERFPAGVDLGMLANDQLGNCVEAEYGHQLMFWTGLETGKPLEVPDAAVVGAYSAITGYDPSDPSTDQGTDPLQACRFWRKHGLLGHRISAFTQFEVRSVRQLQLAVWLFGGADLAIRFPSSAMGQFDRGEPWTPVRGSTIEGGHMVYAVDYDQDGITVCTWGALQRMTWAFWRRYADVGFAMLGPDWTVKGGQSPAGINVHQLQADLAQLPDAA